MSLRALVLAVDGDDFGLPTWTSTLDRVGAAYDVVYTRGLDLTDGMLVDGAGVGRYNAVLLTDALQLYADGTGGYTSGLDANEWNLLWAYERDFAVRQAVLYASYGTWPESYCMVGGTEGAVGTDPVLVNLTQRGAQAFDYLKSGADVPVVSSYVYRNALNPTCDAEPIVTAGNDVLGVVSVSPDGRERAALSFTSNQYLLQSQLFAFGLFRWASHGMHLGEQRHYLKMDIDDWFNGADILMPDFTIDSSPGYEMSGHDAYNLRTQQNALRAKYPLASAFTATLAYNIEGVDPTTKAQCSPNGGIPTLPATSKCLRNDFEWINHTYSHRALNFTDYATSLSEITQNRTLASKFGLTVDRKVLKTGEYSGLGVYHPDPTNTVDSPTDHGLTASNLAMLQAARDDGVRYLHGNLSYASHRPSCHNCGIVHPLEPSLTVVPDWSTNLAYFSSTPDEEVQFYNWFYGPGGRFAFWPVAQTYEQVIDHESDVALSHVASGAVYTHTMHIANVRDFGGGHTLATDWLDALVGKYSRYYSVPLLSPKWGQLGGVATTRLAHYSSLPGVTAVFDPATNTVAFRAPARGGVLVSGVSVNGATTYGPSISGTLNLNANTTVTLTARRTT